MAYNLDPPFGIIHLFHPIASVCCWQHRAETIHVNYFSNSRVTTLAWSQPRYMTASCEDIKSLPHLRISQRCHSSSRDICGLSCNPYCNCIIVQVLSLLTSSLQVSFPRISLSQSLFPEHPTHNSSLVEYLTNVNNQRVKPWCGISD